MTEAECLEGIVKAYEEKLDRAAARLKEAAAWQREARACLYQLLKAHRAALASSGAEPAAELVERVEQLLDVK